MTITRSDGAQVTNADGTVLADPAMTTDVSGRYLFEGLEVLPAGTHYVVAVTAPEGYVTFQDVAGDTETGSSTRTGKAESHDLVSDGDSDLTLDFGYVKETQGQGAFPVSSDEPGSSSSTPPAGASAPATASGPRAGRSLAATGVTILLPILLAVGALGGGLLLLRRHRRD